LASELIEIEGAEFSRPSGICQQSLVEMGHTRIRADAGSVGAASDLPHDA